jgi:hypothetical protein
MDRRTNMSAELDLESEFPTAGDVAESPESQLSMAESVVSPLFPPSFPPLEPLPAAIGEPGAPNGNGDRDLIGRFAAGNRAAAGHAAPLARRVALLRRTLLRSSTPERMRAGVEALWKRFAEGDTAAGKLLLSYCLGPPESLDLIHQVTRLEGLLVHGIEVSNG